MDILFDYLPSLGKNCYCKNFHTTISEFGLSGKPVLHQILILVYLINP
jgi:hypothetical protein